MGWVSRQTAANACASPVAARASVCGKSSPSTPQASAPASDGYTRPTQPRNATGRGGDYLATGRLTGARTGPAMILTTISAAKVAVGFFTALAAVGGGVAVEHAVSGPSTAPAHQAAAAAASGAPTGHGVGPDVHGPAGFGLCNAYAHGGLPPQSVP